MPRHSVDRDEARSSGEGYRSSPRDGHSVRLPLLSLARAGLLSAFLIALIVMTCDPSRHNEESPAWSSPTGYEPGTFWTVAFSLDGQMLATGGDDGGLVLWELGKGVETELSRDRLAGVVSVAFSRDGSTLAAGHGDSMISLWDVKATKKRATLSGHLGVVKCMAFAPDGKTLAGGSSEGPVRIWDVTSGRTKATLLGHRNTVFAVSFAPDGSTLASACGGAR